MHLGNAWIMVRKARPGESAPSQLGCLTQSRTVFVEEVEADYRRAKAAGANLVEELHETPTESFNMASKTSTDIIGFSRAMHGT